MLKMHLENRSKLRDLLQLQARHKVTLHDAYAERAVLTIAGEPTEGIIATIGTLSENIARLETQIRMVNDSTRLSYLTIGVNNES